MNKNNSLTFALVILSSGIVIAIGILIYRTDLIQQFKKEEVIVVEESPKIQPLNEGDHILGNPNADIIVIEYSDFECPYCKEFHNTMRLIIDQFGQDGRVSWIYRQSPLQGEGSNSMRLALTSECISELYNDSKFWQFTNKIFDNSPTSLEKENTDLIIKSLELDVEKINSCVKDSKVADKVNNDINDRDYLVSIDSEFGTPYLIIKTKSGEAITFSGSMPYVMLRDIIEQNSLNFN